MTKTYKNGPLTNLLYFSIPIESNDVNERQVWSVRLEDLGAHRWCSSAARHIVGSIDTTTGTLRDAFCQRYLRLSELHLPFGGCARFLDIEGKLPAVTVDGTQVAFTLGDCEGKNRKM